MCTWRAGGTVQRQRAACLRRTCTGGNLGWPRPRSSGQWTHTCMGAGPAPHSGAVTRPGDRLSSPLCLSFPFQNRWAAWTVGRGGSVLPGAQTLVTVQSEAMHLGGGSPLLPGSVLRMGKPSLSEIKGTAPTRSTGSPEGSDKPTALTSRLSQRANSLTPSGSCPDILLDIDILLPSSVGCAPGVGPQNENSRRVGGLVKRYVGKC